MRWTATVDGSQIGTQVDIEDVGRIGFLMRLASANQSPSLAALGNRVADMLINHWKYHVPDFAGVLRLLEKMDKDKWILEHGGRPIQRKLLDGMFEKLIFARGEDWVDLLEVPKKVSEWTDADEKALSDALDHYVKTGVSDDRYECCSVDEMSQLSGALSQLQEKYGLNFRYEIERLEESIAEHEEKKGDRNREGGGGGTRSRSASIPQTLTTDEDVRQMFSTLGSA